jgi:hypothetical protein
MKTQRMGLIILAAVLAAAPTVAAQTDYLTPEEVTQVRDAQEPNQRVKLFLGFAQDRFGRFQTALAEKDAQPEALDDLLNDFINAVDDTAEALDMAMDRGGVDLRKTRKEAPKKVQELLAGIKEIQSSHADFAGSDLGYDLEDAVMATEDLLALTDKIPDEPIPPKAPERVSGESEQPPTAGRPTLKRPSDRKPEEEKPPR